MDIANLLSLWSLSKVQYILLLLLFKVDIFYKDIIDI